METKKFKRYDPDYTREYYCGSCSICMIEKEDGEYIKVEDLDKWLDEYKNNKG
jgi:hypothetical protein